MRRKGLSPITSHLHDHFAPHIAPRHSLERFGNLGEGMLLLNDRTKLKYAYASDMVKLQCGSGARVRTFPSSVNRLSSSKAPGMGVKNAQRT